MITMKSILIILSIFMIVESESPRHRDDSEVGVDSLMESNLEGRFSFYSKTSELHTPLN